MTEHPLIDRGFHHSAGANQKVFRLTIMRKLILSLFFFGTFAFPVSAEQIFPDDFHSLPVLIQISSANNTDVFYGTGVYLTESNKVFLVTAAHVIFNIESTNKLELISPLAVLSSFDRTKDSTNKNVLVLNLERLRDKKLLKRHPSHDVAVIQIGTQHPPTSDGKIYIVWEDDVISRNRGGFADCSVTEMCEETKNISDGNELYIFGYPVELLNQRIPLEVDFNYPLIRKGIISQRNHQTGKLIIDSGVYGGNSGGPVVLANHADLGRTVYKLAGVITQFVPYQTRVTPQVGVTNSSLVNSGYGVVEPIDFAIELIRQ